MPRLLEALSALPFQMARALAPEDLVRQAVTIIGDDPRVDVLTVAWTVTFEHAWPNRQVRRIGGGRVP
jgi:hypothetical protein